MTTPASYLDYNATAPVHEPVKAAVLAALALPGNPSSVHRAGRLARAMVEDARAKIAAYVGAQPRDLVFTSGGSEANALALAVAPPHARIASAVEHDSVLAHIPEPGRIAVDRHGVIDLAALEARLRLGDVGLVSLMAANNETGTIQPIAAAGALAHAYGALLHIDAVQALGKIAVDFSAWNADLVSLSAHKIGGPKGVGALLVRDHLALKPLIAGGGQELGRRAGTENLPGIAGFAAAVAAMVELEGWMVEAEALRDRLAAALAASGAVVIGDGAERLGNTLVAATGRDAATLIMALDLDGVAVSAGSACSSGKVTPSHVLAAMAVPEALARSAVRISLGWGNDDADIDRLIAAWQRYSSRNPGNAG